MTNATATVEVLSAEVRVLMVGSRQVTLSVYRQLDHAEPSAITPFGRVNDKQDGPDHVAVVGSLAGTLVRSRARHRPMRPWIDLSGLIVVGWGYRGTRGTFDLDGDRVSVSWDGSSVARCEGETWGFASHEARYSALADAHREVDRYEADLALVREWERLPLIVLAGLR